MSEGQEYTLKRFLLIRAPPVYINPSVVSVQLFRGGKRMLESLWCALTFDRQQRRFEMTLRLRSTEHTCNFGALQLSDALVVQAWPAQGGLKLRSRKRGGFELWTQSIWSGQGFVEIRCQIRMTESAPASSQSFAKACICRERRQALGSVYECTPLTCTTFQLIFE